MKVFGLLLLTTALAFGQAPQQHEDMPLLEGISRQSSDSIAAAGNSGDKRYVPFLKPLLKSRWEGTRFIARMALAKLGDREALQYYACRSLTDNPDDVELFIRDDLDNIRGSFSIEVLKKLLDSDQRFQRFITHHKARYSDVIVMYPSAVALYALPKVVPDSPYPAPPDDPIFRIKGDYREYKVKWKTWLESHAEELHRLEPTADGISFDPKVCRHLPDVKTHR